MSVQLTQLQEDRAEYQEQLDLVLVSLEGDADNAELKALREELESALQMIDDSISELKPSEGGHDKKQNKDDVEAEVSPSDETAAAFAAASSTPPAAGGGGGATAAHHARQQQQQQPQQFKLNETVLARWVSGDMAFYPARIMSVTGSASAPMYTVKFKSYNNIETLRDKDIRPVASSGSGTAAVASSTAAAGKRKADGRVVTELSTASSGASTPSAPPPASPPPAPPSQQPPFPSASALATATAQSQTTAGQQQPAPPPPPPPSPPPTLTQPIVAVPPFRSRPFDRFQAGIVSSREAQMYPDAMRQRLAGGGGASASGAGSGAGAGADGAGSGGDAGGSAGGDEGANGGGGDGDGPPKKKFRKIPAGKKLVAVKSKWQDFNNKSKFAKASGKKDSMFRTPEGPRGRVGFTGSGQTMRKDATRSRHTYQTNEELD